jgi:hypothetical protein
VTTRASPLIHLPLWEINTSKGKTRGALKHPEPALYSGVECSNTIQLYAKITINLPPYHPLIVSGHLLLSLLNLP